jgi:BlaI family transcriptional regulator, penicillinase repressor
MGGGSVGRSRKNRLAPLGELQLAVLDVLRGLEQGTVYDILAGFPEERRPRYTTVATVLRSLEAAGLATHETDGRTFVFRALPEAARVRNTILGDVLDRVFGGSPADLMSALLDMGSVTPELALELRLMIEEHRDRAVAEEGDGER